MAIKAAGIHISGSNAQRSAIVVLAGRPLLEPLRLERVYDRIGSSGSMFSDERIVGIVGIESPLAGVFVDCPMTVPPCVSCQRAVCPGVAACEDVSVAYMLSLTGAIKRTGARKKRPINPQSQRLWDITYQADMEEGFEPTYSSNLAPLIVRAQTLQRRFNATHPSLKLFETAIPHALRRICEHLRLDPYLRFSYRSFDQGREIRGQILDALVREQWAADDAELKTKVAPSVDIFHAYIAAFCASLHLCRLSDQKPEAFPATDGWVYLPQFQTPISQRKLPAHAPKVNQGFFS